jgi:3-phenylpropionate/trans-cinnamate dioxygenase ferredoxin subunit
MVIFPVYGDDENLYQWEYNKGTYDLIKWSPIKLKQNGSMTNQTETDFIKAAPVDDVKPGKMLCVAIKNRRILLANDNGTIYAADEMCSHEDASLCTGSLKGHLVKCPLHGSRFDLTTGQPLEDPAEEPLNVYAVKIVDGDIFIKIER